MEGWKIGRRPNWEFRWPARFRQLINFRALVHLGSLAPVALMVFDYYRNNLTANPIQELTFRTGKTALILLVLTLACTPVNTVFKFRPALKVRRTLGLYTFGYVSLHFLIFIGLDYGFNRALLQEAIFEKRFALVGFAAFLILTPLAITSTRGWMRRLGKNWKRLHKLVYLAGLLVILHYVWLVKSDVREPLAYGGVMVLLLAARIRPVRKFLSNFRMPKMPASDSPRRRSLRARRYSKGNEEIT